MAVTALFAYVLSQLLFGLIAASGQYGSGERALELDRCYVEASFDVCQDADRDHDDPNGVASPHKLVTTVPVGSQLAVARNVREPALQSPRSLPPARAPPHIA